MYKIKDLKQNSSNPRHIAKDKLDKLKKSIEDFEQMLSLRPITIDEDGVVLGGNMRLQALKKLGYKEIPDEWVQLAQGLTEAQKKEFIIKDNVGFGEWDWDILQAEWNMQELEEWGMDIPEFDEVELEAQEDDYVEPEQMQVDVVEGDLIEFVCEDGRVHRLLCGDSTDSDAVERLMNGEKADMVFTDPPYLMDFTGGIHGDGSKSFNSSHGGIKNDKLSESESGDFLDGINSNIRLFCKGAFYICFYRLKLGDYYASLKRSGLQVRALITWEKGNHTLSNSDYMSKCEHIFYGWVDEHIFYGGNNGVDVWNIARTQKNTLHPTMKPIALCDKAISDASKKGDSVLDLFGGSGSTLVSAHQKLRVAKLMELDPKYCQVIIDRMQALDETITVKINGEEYVSNQQKTTH